MAGLPGVGQENKKSAAAGADCQAGSFKSASTLIFSAVRTASRLFFGANCVCATATQTIGQAKSYTGSRVAELNQQFTRFSDDVWMRLGDQDRRIDRQGAMGAAMTNMAMNAANARSPRGRVAIGAGWQNGISALSIGYAKQLGDRASFSLSGAFSGSDRSAGVGFGVDL